MCANVISTSSHMNYIFTNKDDLTKIIFFFFFKSLKKYPKKKINILIILRTLNSFDIKYRKTKKNHDQWSEACSANNCLFIYIFHQKKKIVVCGNYLLQWENFNIYQKWCEDDEIKRFYYGLVILKKRLFLMKMCFMNFY